MDLRRMEEDNDEHITNTFGDLSPEEAGMYAELEQQMKDETARQNALTKADILNEAIGVTANRNESYDAPEDNFERIAAFWNAYMKSSGKFHGEGEGPFKPIDVAHMMVLMKMGRLAFNPTHHDSIVDIAGYAGCAGQIASIEREKAK